MSSESELILEVWETFRDTLPAGKREDAVIRLLKVFENHGYDIDVGLLEGTDQYLDEALQAYSDGENPHDDDDDEDDNYSDDD